MEDRFKKYYHLNTKISYMSDADIEKLTNSQTNNPKIGWGKTKILTIDNEKIFLKTIPLTIIEYNNRFDTSNLFNLPIKKD